AAAAPSAARPPATPEPLDEAGGDAASDQASWAAAAAAPEGGESLHARYAFTTPGNEDWAVHRMELVERLDRPYEAVLDLSTMDAVDVDAMLGQRAVFSFTRHDLQRDVQGIIRRVEQTSTGNNDERTTLRVHLVPKVWMLSQTLDTRIFQELTAPDIIKKVFQGDGLALGDDFQLDLQKTYLVREYCVQWEETNLDFAMRLMEEEGIWFRFDHSGEIEKMVLGDYPGGFPGLEGQDGDRLNYTVLAQGAGAEEKVTKLAFGHEVTPNKFTVRSYNWTKPDLRIEEENESDPGNLPLYRHDPTMLHGEYGGTAYGEGNARRQAELMGLRELTKHRATAESDVSTVVAGVRFTLGNHPNEAMNQDWLVVGVRHEGRGPSQGGDGHGESQAEYLNHLELVPASIDWRPARGHWKRRIHSVMTAKVVGPAGEEIHTDEHGRIKVQFHWDRLGKNDDKSSCWMRSMQPWGGEGWGFVFIPRIGMEVLVTFVDGDIDRPLVIGSVYNGKNTPPYALPNDKTKSTIKTNSSPGGDGFNELRFEDSAGHEEIFIHAQKDMNEVVLNNHTRSVGANETISVTGNRTKSVDKNETITITGSQKITITGSETGDGQTIKGGQLDITGKYKLDASDEILVQAPNKITLTCGGSTLVMEPGKITMTSGGKATVVLDADALMEASGHGKVFLDANANLHASGGGDILLDANAVTRSNAGSHVTLDANALVSASAGAQANLTADATVSGANATLSGTAASTVSAPTATLQGGAGSVEASASGVSASGPTVNIAGAGSTSISGAVVKIN
ncbi:MAG: type VI secretion system tip protein VgrG, partial [Deltaproteobacteria bacterium]|nr:type VI secretion system tip protein VgrG [Deltaproteobacteria bacterium]